MGVGVFESSCDLNDDLDQLGEVVSIPVLRVEQLTQKHEAAQKQAAESAEAKRVADQGLEQTNNDLRTKADAATRAKSAMEATERASSEAITAEQKAIEGRKPPEGVGPLERG